MSKNIIITGASRGIGYQTSLELAKDGHTVFAIARSGDKLKELSDKASAGQIIPIEADLTSDEDIQKIKSALSDYERIDGLINNAGAVQRKPFLETEIKEWKQLMDVNVYAIVRLSQALKPKLHSGSHILNISSMSGFQGSSKFPGLAAYSAAKAAVVGLSEVMAVELADDGISVNCLCFGAVQTEMLNEAFPGFEAPVTASEMGSYVADFILKGHRFYNGKVLPVALNNPE